MDYAISKFGIDWSPITEKIGITILPCGKRAVKFVESSLTQTRIGPISLKFGTSMHCGVRNTTRNKTVCLTRQIHTLK